MTNDTKLKKYEDVLMRALNFTEDDLALNAAGQLSAAQIERLKTQRSTTAILAVALSVIVGGLLLFANVYARSLAPLVMMVLIFILFTVVTGIIPALQMTRDLQAGVQVAEGRVELDTIARRRRTTYVVKLNGQKFKVRKMTFLAFKNGDPYRLYYAPHSRTILSAEWLRDDDPFVERSDDDAAQAISAFDDQRTSRQMR
ncbi:MAG: hypothetical protein J0M07_25790 [Anaerolineae bacterium]|nr:hypothetical protein [Anaerolineae bacterium]